MLNRTAHLDTIQVLLCALAREPFARLRQGVGRGALSLVLLFAILTPYAHGFVTSFGRDATDCGMSCCKRARKCCCNKAFGISGHGGTHWEAAAECPPGCRQSPAVFSASPAIVKSGATLVHWVRAHIPAFPEPVRHQDESPLVALFQRPPPLT
jgi:hypothetical protein